MNNNNNQNQNQNQNRAVFLPQLNPYFDFNALQLPPSSNQGVATPNGKGMLAPNFPLQPAPPPPPVAIKDVEVKHCVVVSSNDRDTTQFPNPQYYRVNFDVPYRNVRRVELISAVIPNQANSGSVLDQPILNVLVDELNHLDNTSTNINKAFAVLPLKGASQNTGGFIVPELGAVFNMPREYRTPLASLSRLTISITDLNGTLFNFGTDSAPPTLSLQNVLVFRITTLEKSQDVLQQQTVF